MTATSAASGTPMCEAARAQKPVGSPAPLEPSGGSSDGTSVSQKASRVRRWASSNTSLVARADIASPSIVDTSAE
jgi:hypothetical protein